MTQQKYESTNQTHGSGHETEITLQKVQIDNIKDKSI